MKLITNNVWKYIQKCSKVDSEKFVASAYLGKGAYDLLSLSEDDLLVVDASEGNIKSGVTNPFEIEKFINNGVEVFSYSGLHAKVYVFGRKALIGSANISLNSQNKLTECMLETIDNKTVSEAKGFVRSLALEPLSPEYVNYLKTIYNPPKISKKPTLKDSYNSNIWIQKISDYEYTEPENEAHEAGKKNAEKKLNNKDKYFLNSVIYKNSEAFLKKSKVGDFLICIYGEEVYPPSRILGFEKVEGIDKTVVVYEEPIEPNTIDKNKFYKKMNEFGFKVVCRQFSKSEQKNIILGLWGTVHNYT